MAILVHKSAVGPANLFEMPAAIIEQELIRLATFGELATNHKKPIRVGPSHDRPAIHHGNGCASPIANVIWSVVCDVKIERAVPIDICESHCRAAGFTGGTAG